MTNKYYFRVPYSCSTYGRMSGYVYADNEEEAIEKIERAETGDTDYDDTDSDNYNYYCDEAELTLEEEDVEEPHHNHHYNRSDDTFSNLSTIDQDKMPGYFLSEVVLL